MRIARIPPKECTLNLMLTLTTKCANNSESIFNSERSHQSRNCILRARCYTGFVHFLRPKIQGLFKDFQGPNFEISRTSFLFTSKNLPKEIV